MSRPSRYDIPDSVIGFLRGGLGDPRQDGPSRYVKALGRAGASKPETELSAAGPKGPTARVGTGTPGHIESSCCSQAPAKELDAHREQFGDTSRLTANPILLRTATVKSTGCNWTAVFNC